MSNSVDNGVSKPPPPLPTCALPLIHASHCSSYLCKTQDCLGDVQLYSNALDAEGSEQASAQTVGKDMVKPICSFLSYATMFLRDCQSIGIKQANLCMAQRNGIMHEMWKLLHGAALLRLSKS